VSDSGSADAGVDFPSKTIAFLSFVPDMSMRADTMRGASTKLRIRLLPGKGHTGNHASWLRTAFTAAFERCENI
jgi:hypothetical protein